jgi:putative ABC transport system substrate-binding protein
MRRRAFVQACALALGIADRTVRAEQAPRVLRIGFLQPGVRPPTWFGAFRQGLQELGYIEGENVAIEHRIAESQQDLSRLVTELLRQNVSVIVTWTTPAALAAKHATSSVPIVAITGNPVETGVVASLARPGMNVTGIAILTNELEVKNLELLKQMVPSASRIAGKWNPHTPI